MGRPFFRNVTPTAARGRWSVLPIGEEGFTLIELMASVLIVALLAAGVAQGLITSGHLSGYERHRSQADELAQQDQERLRGMSSTQLDALNQSVVVPLDGTRYTVTSTAQFRNSTGGASCGTSGPGAAAYYGTSSTVAWTDSGGTHSVNEDSVISPPASGSLLVQVDDQTNTGLPGVSVTANGPDVASQNTDGSGCAILAGLAQGDYNLAVADSGYVDPNGNTSPLAATATLTTSGTATPSTGNPMHMGLAATLNVTGLTATDYTSSPPATQTATGQSADAVSWFGAGGSLAMNNSATQAAPTGTLTGTYTINNLFPFAFGSTPPFTYANDYQVWAGKCRQMQPPTGVDEVSSGVTPGSTQSITVQEPAVKLAATWRGVSTQPTDIKVKFASTSGTACNDEWSVAPATATAAAANGWLSTPGQPFASTATTTGGAMPMSASGLTGTLQICVDYRSGTTYYQTGWTGATPPPTFTNTSFTTPTLVTEPNVSTTSTTGQCT